MNCDIFIPVRLASTRLPRKQMKLINGKQIILHLVERLKSCNNIRKIIICTTNLSSDDSLVELLKNNEIDFYRGSEKDLLDRFLCAAREFQTDFIVNVDGDDIYTDPFYVDEVVKNFHDTNANYIDMIGFPFGLRLFGFSRKALEKAYELKNTNDTETGYRDFFTTIPQLNEHKIMYVDKEFSKNIRLSLDYEEDLMLAKEIFNKLGNFFHLSDILKLFENKPDLLKITLNLEKKWEQHFNKDLTNFSIRNSSS